MLNFVVVEDNAKHKKIIQKEIVNSMMKNNIDFKLNIYNDDTKELREYISDNKYDTVYILDIELPSGDGLELADYIRYKMGDWKNPIIICSSHTSLAFEVYMKRFQLLDFAGKCYDFQKSLNTDIRLCLKMFDLDNNYIFSYRNTEYRLEYSEIDYIQKIDRKVIIVTSQGDFYQCITIKDINMLLPKYFIPSSKGIIINAKNIDKIDRETKLVYFKDGLKDYIVSKKHRKELNKYVK